MHRLVIQANIKEAISMSDKYHDSDKTTAVRLIFNMARFTFRKFTLKHNKSASTFHLTADGARNFCEPHLIKSPGN